VPLPEIIDQLAERIRDAAARRAPLRIRGGGTKDFYGRAPTGEILDMRVYSGIVDYEPTELVVTGRAGTPLEDIEAAMERHGQMLAFEPPRFGSGSTLGGAIASGLSGPRRAYAGAARDFVLGVRMLDGKGSDLSFGGRVMKNVAGYDVSRLMTGALGTLGVLTEISLKVLPRPPAELTLRQERSQADAIRLMNAWAGKPHPITATCHSGAELYVRLSGAEPAVRAARVKLGGEEVPDGAAYWNALRDHRLPFFDARPLWRASVKSTTPPLSLNAPQIVEWGGAVRWLCGTVEPDAVRAATAAAGGHATLFRGEAQSGDVFHPLAPSLQKLHRRLKDTFDPQGILNRGRMYADW
jgi:glycolate oxidase FAD binding subunit